MALNFLVWIILHCGWLSCNCRMFRLILGLYAVDASSMILSSSSLPPTHNNWNISAAAAAKSLQSCLTLCNPIDGSPLGSPDSGILQARTLERVAFSFSSAWKWKVKVKLLSRVQLITTPWTAAYQAPPSMVFSRQEYWSGVPLPSPHTRLDLFKTTLKFFGSLYFIIINMNLYWLKYEINHCL